MPDHSVPAAATGSDGGSIRPLTVLVVGVTGSIGRPTLAASIQQGHRTRALVRDAAAARSFPAQAHPVIGDLTRADTLTAAVDGVDAVVFTHGSHGGAREAERVDYGAVRNTLTALGARPVRIALMSTVGVTRHTPGHDWKRRGERLVRASGLPCTIVRPGWFDSNGPDQHRLVLDQGDRKQAGDPSDGVVSRLQIAQVLIASLTSAAAVGTTFELSAERGPAQTDLEPLFAALQRDTPGGLDAVLDVANMPLEQEPPTVRAHLHDIRGRWNP